MSALRVPSTFPLRLPIASLCCVVLMGGCKETDLVGAQFVSTPDTAAPADEEYVYDSIAAGVFPGSTVYDLLAAPAGMVVDPTGLVTWTPTIAELGNHAVELLVNDGSVSTIQAWQIQVHQDLVMGVLYSPRGHAMSILPEAEEDFALEHAEFGRLVGYWGSWRDSLSEAGTVPTFAVDALDDVALNGYEYVIGFSWAAPDGTADLLSDGNGMDNSWSNQETRDEFLSMVEGFAQLHQPAYLFLGNEVNTWYLQDPAGWADWLTELEACALAIKAVSPATLVFSTFQLEHMKGLGGGTQGWMDAAHWNLVDDLELGGYLDGLGFTSFPYFEYATPQAIPAGYYDEITAHWSGPILFTEVAWPATANAPYPGGLTAQEDMLGIFLGQLEPLPVELGLWIYLHDFDGQGATPAHTDVGFRSNDGLVVRPSEAFWKAAVSLRERPLDT